MKIKNQKRYHPIRALTAANRGIGIQILLVANYALENVIVFCDNCLIKTLSDTARQNV